MESIIKPELVFDVVEGPALVIFEVSWPDTTDTWLYTSEQGAKDCAKHEREVEGQVKVRYAFW